jgi:histidinol-phosphatase (PHP family)
VHRCSGAAVIPYDYHIHSDFSADCNTPMAEMCRSALHRGIPEIGFTEHLDLLPFDPGYATFRVDAWWRELERCREVFAPALSIRAGVELSEPHRVWHAAQEAVRRYPWDYVVGALHFVGETLVFDRAYFDRPADEAYGAYFEELAQVAGAGGYDVLAHADIVKRYGHAAYGAFDPCQYKGEIRAALRACARNRIALEVNTSTLRRPVAELSPSLQILIWFREEGGRLVTIGSDAHLPSDVGAGLDRALEAVGAAGFETLSRFEGRRPIPIPLPRSDPEDS